MPKLKSAKPAPAKPTTAKTTKTAKSHSPRATKRALAKHAKPGRFKLPVPRTEPEIRAEVSKMLDIKTRLNVPDLDDSGQAFLDAQTLLRLCVETYVLDERIFNEDEIILQFHEIGAWVYEGALLAFDWLRGRDTAPSECWEANLRILGM